MWLVKFSICSSVSNSKGKLLSVHALKAYGQVELQLRSLLTLAQHRCDKFHAAVTSLPEKEPPAHTG
jgi:hypothetical protein